MWTFIIAGVHHFINKEYPEIQFKKKNTLAWLWQGLCVAAVLLVIGKLVSITSGILSSGVK
jgi:hypothetical protein